MSLKKHIVRQFRKPSGVPGGVAGRIMAHRRSNRLRNARTVEMMQLAPDMQVLEIGCGPGVALLRCAEIVVDGGVVGLDHSDVMIEQARVRLARANLLDRVELLSGDVARIGALDRRFDRAFSLNVVQFIDDRTALFNAIHEALAPGGAVFTTYQARLEADPRGAVTSQTAKVVDAMRAAGFINIATSPIAPGQSTAVCISGTRSG